MKTHATPLSINILYWLNNFFLFLMSLAFLFSIGFNIFIFTGAFNNNPTMDIPFPVEIDFPETGNLLVNDHNLEVELVDVKARMKILNPPDFVIKRMGFIMIYGTIFSILLMVIFRKFIKNVRVGIIFTVENINLLKFLSYGLIALWVFQAILMRIWFFYLAIKLEFNDASLRVDFTQYSSTLIIALVIWVLAHIFLTGVRLQEEKDLTI